MKSAGTMRLIARVMLAALFFAQATLTLAACDWAARAPAQAFSARDVPPCHEAPSTNANLCLADCLSEDQSAVTPQLPVFSMVAVSVPVLAAAPHALSVSRVHGEFFFPDPPPRIRFNRFSI